MRVLALSVLYLFYWPPFFGGSALYRKYYRTSQYICMGEVPKLRIVFLRLTQLAIQCISGACSCCHLKLPLTMLHPLTCSALSPGLTLLCDFFIYIVCIQYCFFWLWFCSCKHCSSIKNSLTPRTYKGTRHVRLEFPKTATVSYSTRHRNSANDSKYSAHYK